MATNIPSPLSVREKLVQYFESKPDIEFVMIFNPLMETAQQPLTNYDLAIQLPLHYTLLDIFHVKRKLYDDLYCLLSTEKINIVALNDCPRLYQKVIFNTGSPLFVRNRKLYHHFIESFSMIHNIFYKIHCSETRDITSWN
jgi:hypothetical protein